MLSPSEPVKIAIVGCGRISNKHFEAIRTNKAIQLVGVCDTNMSLAQSMAKEHGVEAYDSLPKMLESSKADVVTLCTPSGLHATQGIMAARAGKHVITEKPMATNWADGKSLVDACDEAGVHLFVVKQNRCNPTLRALKDAVNRKRFGRIYSVAVNVFWCRPQDYYDSASWRGTWEFDGGALMNQASHYIDLLDWLVGPIESVQAYTATLARNIQVEDTGVVAVRWRSGALGTVNVTMLTPKKNYEGSILIIGEKGLVKVGGVALNKVEQWDFLESEPGDAAVTGASYQTESVYGNGHAPYYENAVKVLRGEAAPETDGREGLKSLEVIIATYLSARDGRRLSLPLEH